MKLHDQVLYNPESGQIPAYRAIADTCEAGVVVRRTAIAGFVEQMALVKTGFRNPRFDGQEKSMLLLQNRFLLPDESSCRQFLQKDEAVETISTGS